SGSPSSGDDGETAKNSSFLKSKKPESEVEDSEAPQSGGEDEEDGDEEEYEIEAILDAKKGQFGKNKMGYFVKWKGYGPEHNSWVAEDDAGYANLFLRDFFFLSPSDFLKKSPKKALEPKRSRKSMGDDLSDAGGSASAVKKRGRKSVSEKPADKEEDERPTKKPRKTAEKKTDAHKTTSAEPLPDEEVGTMKEHMQAPTWDQLIKKIDTVERIDDTLFVYFTLNGGERIREDSKICADKFPKMLIEFYESNLRW
ncbi:hypothetical protein K438DRAFT_1486439, partial [Mycena galopus ATCC 62051]